LLGQLSRVPDAKVVERQVGERDPLQLVDLEAKAFDHAVDLAVLAFVERDAEPRVLAFARQDLHLRGHRRRSVVERHAVAQRGEMPALEVAVYLDVVGLGHVIAGCEQPRRQLAVVGQQQHALAVEVEPTDGLDWHG
jgi:hypothetical protein